MHFQYQVCSPEANALNGFFGFHRSLQASAQVPVQLENTTPVCIVDGRPSYNHHFTRFSDYQADSLSMALDISHLAITLYGWSKVRKDRSNGCFVDSPLGRLFPPLTTEDLQVGKRIATSNDVPKAITDEVIAQIQSHARTIGSLQFSNARYGVGTDDLDEGYAGTDGLLDMYRILSEVVLHSDIPYVIPEYHERDYLNPVEQQKAVGMVRQLQERLSVSR